MTLDDFVELDERYRVAKPSLFRLSTPDRPATESMIASTEKQLGIRLPESYKGFLRRFGGGNYGLVVVFSADPEGDWYLPRMQLEAERYLPKSLLAFSDDFAGGNYVLGVEEGWSTEPVRYWNADGGLSSTPYATILDFIARFAYEPS